MSVKCTKSPTCCVGSIAGVIKQAACLTVLFRKLPGRGRVCQWPLWAVPVTHRKHGVFAAKT